MQLCRRGGIVGVLITYGGISIRAQKAVFMVTFAELIIRNIDRCGAEPTRLLFPLAWLFFSQLPAGIRW
jgi:hypothetical protein